MASTINLVVASANPVKVQAAANGFRRLFPGSELNVITAAVPFNNKMRYTPQGER